jgi:hypothetical protein
VSAADDFRRRGAQLERMTRDIFANVAVGLHQSIQVGSPVTGAPGQPLDLGTLRNSWMLEFDGDTASIGTNVEYAEAVEDAVGPYGPRVYGAKNNIGGSHSVKMTVAGAQRIVDLEVARRAAQAGGA